MSETTIDFLRRRRTPWLGWCLLAAGAFSLIAVLWLERNWTADRRMREASALARVDSAQNAQRIALQPVPPTPDQRRFDRVAPQLRQPWLPTLRLIENVTQAPVFLLGLSIDPANGAVRLEGEAATFEQAIAFAQALSDDAVIGPAHLRSHEVVNDSTTGQSVTRFSIVTTWKLR